MDHDVKVLGLSTAHFSPIWDEEHLKETCTMSSEYGYLVYPGDNNNSILLSRDGITDGLREVLSYAQKENYDYVLFDRDAPEHEELPTFEEDWREAHVSAKTPADA